MSQLVHALGHVKMNTNCIDESVRDATDVLGLRVTRETGTRSG